MKKKYVAKPEVEITAAADDKRDLNTYYGPFNDWDEASKFLQIELKDAIEEVYGKDV